MIIFWGIFRRSVVSTLKVAEAALQPAVRPEVAFGKKYTCQFGADFIRSSVQLELSDFFFSN